MGEMGTRTQYWTEKTYQTTIRNVAWNPEGTRLAGGSVDTCVYVWDSVDATLQERLLGHQDPVNSVAWSPNGIWLASAGGRGGKGEVVVWKMQRAEPDGERGGERVRDLQGHLDVVRAVTWSPSSDQLISGDSEGRLCWWNPHSGQCLHAQAAHEGTIRSLKVSPDGTILASCGIDGAIKLWDLQSRECVQTLRYERPYERLNITGIRGLTQAEIATLRALGAVQDDVL